MSKDSIPDHDGNLISKAAGNLNLTRTSFPITPNMNVDLEYPITG